MPRKQERCRRAAFGEGAKGRFADKMGPRGSREGVLPTKWGHAAREKAFCRRNGALRTREKAFCRRNGAMRLAGRHFADEMGLRGLAKGHFANKMGDREEMNY